MPTRSEAAHSRPAFPRCRPTPWMLAVGRMLFCLARLAIPRSVEAIVAGWAINELDDPSRDAVGEKLLAASRLGVSVLIVEPIASRVSPWWDDWARAFTAVDARVDEWRFHVELPDLLRRLDRAAGLRHDELKAKSLYVGPR